MNDDTPDTAFDEKLRAALGPVEAPDFDAWRQGHAEAVAYLNPVVTNLQRRKRKLMSRAATGILAAAACGIVLWFFVPEREAFAFSQAIRKIDNAETITWTATTYQRITSKDGNRSWLVSDRSQWAYRRPGLFRIAKLDHEGNPRWIHIADSRTGRTLDFDLKTKKVMKGPDRYQMLIDPQGRSPFEAVANTLRNTPLELVGQRKVNGKAANVFRVHARNPASAYSADYWIDAKSKQLLGWADPGANLFDPETDPDRNTPAEKESRGGKMVGGVRSDIVFDAKLEPELFSLAPPAGYEIVKEPVSPPITEADFIAWLEAMAGVNKNVFPSALKSPAGYEPTHWTEIARKRSSDRTETERRMYDLVVRYGRSGDEGAPLERFLKENAIAGSFRYVGVGVPLGSADRIVCWYKLKSTGVYRAIFGDLTVKALSAKDLPLPIEQ